MTDSLKSNGMANDGNRSESPVDYKERAVNACEAGDLVLAMHLYLAAYEKAVAESDATGTAFTSLHEAWNLACNLKERSMAEYVFEKLEPYLTGEEIARYAGKLQSLALDRLEEYGFSREELQDMAEMISQDLMTQDGSVLKVESFSIPRVPAAAVAEQVDAHNDASENPAPESPALPEPLAWDEAAESGAHDRREPTHPAKPGQIGIGRPGPDFNPYDEFQTSSVGMSYHGATNEGAGSYVFTRDVDRASELERSRYAEVAAEAQGCEQEPESAPESATAAREDATGPAQLVQQPAEQPSSVQPAQLVRHDQPASQLASNQDLPAMPEAPESEPTPLTYRTLSGYGEAVSIMRELGIGLQRDPSFVNFVNMMNARHGIDRMPVLDTLLFRAPVIEDAARFVDATAGELGLPIVRMSMEESVQGMPLLCVTIEGNRRPRMNHAHNRFEGPGILIIEDLDMWEIPQPLENAEGIAGFMMANISRGAREALNLIRSAVEDPDVRVLVTATTQGEVDPFFYEMLEPMSIIDIAYPNDVERDDIWTELLRDHSSMRGLDQAALVRYSNGLARYDIYMAARAAVEEAYKTGLAQRAYVPVTMQNIYDKLAACQPLDSPMYHDLEDAIMESFREELSELESFVDGSGE